MGGSKAKTVLCCLYSTGRCEQFYIICFIEPDMCMAKNWKALKRFFSALSALDKTVRC